MGLKVQKRMCKTCIYGPNSAVLRSIEDLEREVADPHMPGHFSRHRQCHHSDKRTPAVCRGFWERHKDHFAGGQLAQRLNCVDFVDVDVLKPPPRRKAP